jgi:hypothetical protein
VAWLAGGAGQFRRGESPRPVREDGEQHKGAAGIPFEAEVGSVGAHQSLSMVACAADGELTVAARCGGWGG